MISGELITTEEAAAKLGVSVRRVQAMLKSGRLPGKLVSRVWWIKLKDLKLVEGRKRGRPKSDG